MEKGDALAYKKPNAKMSSSMVRCDRVMVMEMTTGTGSAKIKKSVTM